MKIKKILISQPAPKAERSPYFELAKKHKLKIDFQPFIKIEGIPAKDFRKKRINILNHDAIILTSRTAVDHFFRVCEDLRIRIPESMRYFCTSEATALYLQKYIEFRKRKIFFGKKRFDDLIEIMLTKHKDGKYLLPVSDVHKQTIPNLLKKNKIQFTKAVLYRTVSNDLSEIAKDNYDVFVFFTPAGVKSFVDNFPEFKQNGSKIASFGKTTTKAVKDAGFKVDIQAPTGKAPSMIMALDQYINTFNKKS